MITVLSGGTGTPKLLQGMKEIIKPSKITVIVNTVENDYFSGLYVAPDVDTVLYTLADLINEDTWYGIKNDTFITHKMLKKLGCPELLRIGDKDRAFKIQKTLLLKDHTLSEAVDIQRKALGIKSRIIPMSNEPSNIKIITENGPMSFHQFLVKEKSEPKVIDIQYNTVNPAPGVIDAIKDSRMVVIGPSNPITSIGPIISTKGIKKALEKVYVVAVSPIAGGMPFSGPAAKFMKALGYEASSLGVCHIYADFLDKFVIDEKDFYLEEEIEKLIKEVIITNTNMKNFKDKIRLARIILGEIV
ncbi:MAG TPA: 2-phospho-L-lactate transferase [Methanothermobacter sp.]|nr:2-phospho-L-lactate transferase [Methanothermobacter sp. MT-2]HHW05427.1 2-phospho-L-lactate transferase [Methanothermobacter sp.]HOK73182.1 2-phospho-L-lactate transferase [Methanothermobacter sp.]HOL68814.1 2-phospho-L-lactate transferase [Methanothermobacter sp.]HPQ04707.1 2-phospho-L-lactate transferase [Methanothermobacter sp.]